MSDLMRMNYSNNLGSIKEGIIAVKNVKPNGDEDIPYSYDTRGMDSRELERFIIRMFADMVKKKVAQDKDEDGVRASLKALTDSLDSGRIESTKGRVADPRLARLHFFANQDLQMKGLFAKRGIKPSSKEGVALRDKYIAKYNDRLNQMVTESLALADSIEIDLDDDL